MDSSPTVPPEKPGKRRWALWTFGALVLAATLGVLAWKTWFRIPGREEPDEDAARLEALYAASPFRNVRPDVKYVGDEACATCHQDIDRTYHAHPMGRSMTLVPRGPWPEPIDASANNPFERLGFQFTVERRGDAMIHRTVRRDSNGRVVAEKAEEVRYVLGSGTRGKSYLFEHDGFLFQSPISWFSQKDRWDLSPGFEKFLPRDRGVEPSCLFCHANRVEPVAGRRNHYREPVFRGLSVGCERCHGPGELHVTNPGLINGVDPTIVNPKHLAPDLREAICQQCHLQGEQHFERRGRHLFDFRPGLPWDEFEAVFVRAPDFGPARKAVGHFEQMLASQCYRKSNGKMGCATCHDPHVAPSTEEKGAYFRGRCLTCHQDMDCKAPAEERRAKKDACTVCHLPRFASSDIVHTAVTDHRILRRPDKPDSGAPPSATASNGLPIVSFFRQGKTSDDPRDARDLGIALATLARNTGPPGRPFAQKALPLLDEAVRTVPRDLDAGEARGWALVLLGRPKEALEAFEAVLAREPERENALGLAAQLAESQGKPDEALAHHRKVIELSPWVWGYRINLAEYLARRKDWAAALKEGEEALRLSPASPETRMLLIEALLHLGQRERAEREFQTLLVLRPEEEGRLRAWFAEQKSRP
jgi:Flp pilus assembly protein TadD